MKKSLLTVAGFATLSLISFYACQKDKGETVASNATSNPALNVYQSAQVEHGMLVFASKQEMDMAMIELNSLTIAEFEAWEKSKNINTQFSAFNAVVKEEGKISDYYESLPAEEQATARNQPQPHSDIYNEMMDKGVLMLIKDNDGNEYFNYAVSNPTMTKVINLEGFVKAGDWIYQFNDKGVKIILDGDFSKIETLKSMNENLTDKTYVIHQSNPHSGVQDRAISNNWTVNTPWTTSGKRRWKVWLDGHSESYGGLIDEDCTQFLNCAHTVRSEAQKKNFWGNWVYNDFYPSLSFTHVWSYNYCRYNDNLCGLYKTCFSSVAPYSCTGNPSFMCPTSPHTASYPSTNNGFFNQTPHGVWSASGPYWPSGLGYFSDAFDATGNVNATYNGTAFIFSY
jgi:hypothetical protein